MDSQAPAGRWAWLALPAASAVWLVFFALVGFRGWNLQEDGYLLTLAHRVVAGEVPYRDFEYIRPPLPVAIQAVLLHWIPGYAVAGSRWYFALEVGVILAAVYGLLGVVEPRPLVRAAAALLAVIVALTGGFPPMPWHTVDGLCLSILGAWALVAGLRRRSPALLALAGIGAAAAALSKQGFAVVAVVGAMLTLTGPGRRIGTRPWHGALAYGGGVAAVGALTLGYLASQGALAAFVQSVILDPREITREVGGLKLGLWDLVLGMHLPRVRGAALGLVMLALVTLPMPDWLRLLSITGGLLWALGAFLTWGRSDLLDRFVLTDGLATLGWLGGAGLLAARALGRAALPTPAVWALALALATLYASTWSYVGAISRAQGLVLALPLVLLGLVAVTAGEGSGARRARRFAAGALAGYAALHAVLMQATVPHRDGSQGEPIVPFRSERLRGIRSAASRVGGVDGVIEVVRRETVPGDFVFAFMNFPALYFLADRRNPTRLDWLIPVELTLGEVRRALADLAQRPPRLVVVSTHDPRAMVESPRLRPIFGYIVNHYERGEAIGEFIVFRPRRP